ncbi:chemotaxis protein CheW [Pelosinus sp. sgz500959]|uniref:chemotaxis protein CheW n=1 Tax=Pelosinus sp. sgz500959 TaxID=3242472 RepID=UPI00366E1E04
MSDDGMSREPMLEMYLFEGNQLVEQLEEIIIKCEKDKKFEMGAINEIFRIMHTVKGSSAMMMFNQIGSVAHSMEDLFFFIRANQNVEIDFGGLSDLVLSGIDFIKAEMNKIEQGNAADGIGDGLIEEINALLTQMKNSYEDQNMIPAVVSNSPPEGPNTKYYISSYQKPPEEKEKNTKYCVKVFFEEDCQMENIRAYMVVNNLQDIVTEMYYIPSDVIDNGESADIIRENGFLICFNTIVSHAEVESTLNQTAFLRKMEISQVDQYPDEIKVLHRKIDILLEDIPEVDQPIQTENIEIVRDGDSGTINNRQQNIISVSVSKLDMLMDIVGEIVISEAMVTKNPDLAGLSLEGFSKAARQLRKLTDELQDIVMSIRMVPVSMVFQKMNRIVRDMSKRLGKEADLEIIGETTEVDKNIIDHLSDPLMHLIRNAMDHGLESKEERLRSGKPSKGKITLEAKNAGGDVLIIVRDDGKGLNRDKILNKAKERGLVNKPDHELTDKEVFSYILLAGFSTNEQVTEFSGRGVGMDVVSKNIEKIGGSITIESTFGKGTEIFVKIPLTLAIIDGIEVGVGKSRYTIPTISIRESFRIDENDVTSDGDGNEMIMIRGQCYPVLRIHRMFNIKNPVTRISEGIMVMIESDSKVACLFVDRLVGEQQVVVKALPRYLKKVQGIAGCTILGDGGISLILDINGILERQLS